MIYEHFRATGAYEAVHGLSDLITFSLQNDDVQDFDVRWDQKLQNSAQVQIVLALYDQETGRVKGKSNYSQLKTPVKPSY